MLFYTHCGSNMILSGDRKRAGKLMFANRLQHDPVFSEYPMEMGRLYEVAVMEIWMDHELTALGVVTQHPTMYPTSGFDIGHSSVVHISHDGILRFGHYEYNNRPYLKNIPRHSRVGLALDRERTLHLFFNGFNMGVVARNIPSPCYFMYDVFLRVQLIEALPITIIDALNQELPQGNASWSANQPSH